MEKDDIANLIPLGARINQPLYIYQTPMFMITASVVVIVEDAVVVVKTGSGLNRFPGGPVQAGKETIQFAAIRYLKEQTGVAITKNSLYPVDFRSDPERSPDGNIVDVGLLSIPEKISLDDLVQKDVSWLKVDFEAKKLINKQELFMDHNLLLERAIEVFLFMH